MTRAWVAVLLALGIAIFTSELGRRDGIRGGLERLALRDSLARSARVVDSLERALAAQVPVTDRWLTRWDTLTVRGDTVRVRDTLYVPYRVLVVADSVIQSCRATLGTCRVLADSLRGHVGLLRRDVTLAEAETRTALRREWWAVGLVYDGQLGGVVERDVGRLRAGLSVTPTRAQGWVGVRF